MNNDFFKNKFTAIREATTPEWRDELIKHMVTYFTTHVLSTIEVDDYVVPNYVRKLLNNYDYEYITTPEHGIEYVIVNYKDFTVLFGEKYTVKDKEHELRQKILKHSKINYATLSDEEVDDEKDVFNTMGIDVLILDYGYNGGDIYVRDKYCPYLIHKYISYDNDIYSAIDESNRSITEFLAKVEYEHIISYFL
ncbi:MAG: hypothetical protein QW042_04530 [Thermoplasmata archaeon]